MTAAAVVMLDNEPIKCCVNVNNIAFGLLKQLWTVDCAAACFFWIQAAEIRRCKLHMRRNCKMFALQPYTV